jgi:hypothetical protein
VRGEGHEPRGLRPGQDDPDSDDTSAVAVPAGTSSASGSWGGALVVRCRCLPSGGSCFDRPVAPMGPLRGAVEGFREEFHGARPLFGVYSGHETAAGLDQAWEHVAHLCMRESESESV